jgi:hypothetical protein
MQIACFKLVFDLYMRLVQGMLFIVAHLESDSSTPNEPFNSTLYSLADGIQLIPGWLCSAEPRFGQMG